MHAQTTALVDREASARRSKKTFVPHAGRVPRTARIARKDGNFEAPFGGLGCFSCKRSFFLEEYLLRAMFSVVNKDGAINLRDGEDIVNLPLLCRLDVFFYRKAKAVGPAGVWKKQFRLRKIWLTFVTFCGY